MKRHVAILFLLMMLSVVSNAAVLPIPIRPVDKQSTIAVVGRGDVQAVPDIATVYFQATGEASVIPPAVQAARAAMNKISAALRNDGVSPNDIQTSAYTVSPKIAWNNGTSRTIGYTAANRIKVTIRNLNQAGQILADAVAAGADQVNGLEYALENKGKWQILALKKAVEDAKMKAGAIAQVSGMQLGSPIFFSESNYFQPPIRPFYAMAKTQGADASQGEPVSPGKETISAVINATFAMTAR